MTTKLSLEALAAVPRWDVDRINALPGRVRGNALRAWGQHVERLWGRAAPDLVRERLGLTASILPNSPTKKHWVPIWAQIRLPQIIVDEWLDGDILAFETLFGETTGTTDKVMFWLGSKVGPTAVLKRANSYHARVCDAGTLDSSAGPGWAKLHFQDAEVFANPSWRVLQILGMRTMFSYLNRRLDDIHGVETGPRNFEMNLAWKG